MDTAQLTVFMVFALTACVTPGPNNLMLMMSGNLFGWRASIPHIAGIVIGFGIVIFCAVLGLTVQLQQLPWLTWTVRILGTAWLGWLGLKFIYAAFFARAEPGSEAPKKKARPLTFIEAALFQWANPKSIIVATSASSAFITISPDTLHRAIILAGGFSLAGLVSTHVWTLSGTAISKLLSTGQYAHLVQAGMGLLIFATALSLPFI